MATKTKTAPEHMPPTGFAFDADTHSYYFDGKPMTGCTTILGVLAKPALIQWAANEAVKFIRDNAPHVDSIGERETSYEVSPELLDEARTAHARKRDDAAEKGTDLHALVEEYVRQCIERRDGKPDLVPLYESIQPFIKWAVDNNIRFIASEKQLYSKELWVAGTCDLVFEKDGKRYVGDIKTYAKIWDRTPFYQCAGYPSEYLGPRRPVASPLVAV
jgi:hypothetical protein